MAIDQYSFGQIDIDGRRYDADVIILPDRVLSSWWREEGHNLCEADLAEVLAAIDASWPYATAQRRAG